LASPTALRLPELLLVLLAESVPLLTLLVIVDEQMQGLSRQLGHCCSEHQTAVATASHDGSKSTVAAVAAAVGTSYKRQ
jgi:hypothetical protein